MTWAQLDMLIDADPEMRRPEPAKLTGTMADVMTLSRMGLG